MLPKHVTILGAGVIGLSTALYCARRGMKVTVIEKKHGSAMAARLAMRA
jgi:glycine/D-amino acid oxidase-like deaminating enzyme